MFSTYCHFLYQIPIAESFFGIPSTGWSAITAIGTFLAVGVALGISLFQDRRIRAYLDFKINLAPPDCHKIITSRGFYVIYLRIKISHLKGKAAENVEIMVTNFWHIRPDGSKDVVAYFLPMNLVWSHFQPRLHVLRVPAGLFRHCDLGFVAKTEDGTILKLDTLTQPNSVEGGEIPNIIKPGKYQFELLLSGDNVQSKSKIFELELDGVWSDDEAEMLKKHIKIHEL